MLVSKLGKRLSACTLLALASTAAMSPAFGQSVYTADKYSGAHGGQLDVPLNKSQILNVDRNFSRAMIGNDEIADILPMTNRSLYVLGKQMGTTSLTLYDSNNRMISVVDVAVGPDVVSLRRQLEQLIPGEKVGANISNDSIVLTGVVSNAPAVDRAVQLARTYAGDNVVNMMSVGGTQQVMLEVRFSEINRQAGKQIGLNHTLLSNGQKLLGGVGSVGIDGAGAVFNALTGAGGDTTVDFSPLASSQGAIGRLYNFAGLDIVSVLDALERKGLVKTLAEPTLVALSGETASFLAGGEFPIPVLQDSGGNGGGSGGISIEFKPFGVSLAFTPTVLADGVINLAVEPEVSSIDPSASISVNGLVIPGLQTRRAKSTIELRDGESFALAGLIRHDFQNTVRQIPILGSIPIIGALFRSTSFAKGETELVMIVTPRLVKPMKADMVSLPTDRVRNPTELELFLMGRTDKAVGVDPFDPDAPPPEADTTIPAEGGFIGPNGYEF